MTDKKDPSLLDPSNGMPDIPIDERDAGEAKSKRSLFIMSIIVPLIGLGAAYAIYSGNETYYDPRFAVIRKWDMQWAYLAAFFFFRLVAFLNMYPMAYKSRIMRGSDGNLRANMYIYQISGAGPSALPILFDDGPETGKYNRANRSLTHFTENAGPMCLGMALSAFAFPKATFFAVLTFSFGRMLHQHGYATVGYGIKGHAPGFILAMLSGVVIEGMILLAAVKSF